MAFEISDIIDVSAAVAAGGAERREFGRTLFVTTESTLPAGGSGKVETFATQGEVDARFPADSEPVKAAKAYFGQDPRPKNMLIGRWAESNVSTTLEGGSPSTAATLIAVTNGSFVIGGEAVTGLNFSGDTSYADIAATIQTAIRNLTDTRFALATVDYATTSHFTITLPSRGDIGGGLENHSSGTAVAALLGLDDDTATYKLGSDAETVGDALSRISALDGNFTFFALESSKGGTQTMLDAAAWGSTRQYIFSAASFESAALTTGESATFAARLAANGYPRAFLTWSASADYKSLAIAGIMGAVNFSQPNSLVTAKFRTLSGFSADTISNTALAELNRKRINYYVQFGDNPIYAEGVTTKAGIFIDTQFWLDWLSNAVQTAIWNQLRASAAVPQTNSGLASIRNSVVTVLEEGVVNGGIAPGEVSPDFVRDIRDTVGNPDFDGLLSTGYLVNIGSLAAQSQSDREARKLPPIKVWLKGSGAIHSASIGLVFEA